MESVLLGYFPKQTMASPDWLGVPAVEEICSVSNCMSKGPDDWIKFWRHNDRWMFDTPELAWSVVDESDRERFDLYAYALFNVEFRNGIPSPIELPKLNAAPLVDSQFDALGFGVVSSSTGNDYECSPLSCNGLAATVDVNKHCLLDKIESGVSFAQKCESEGCEPGPYYLMKVWRQKRDKKSG